MGIKDWMGSAYRRRRPCRTPSSLLSSRLSLPSPLSPSSSSSTLSSPSSPLMRRRSKRISRHKPLYLSLSSFSSSSSPSFPSLLSRSPPGSLTSCLSTSASPVPPSSLHSSSSSFLSTVSSPYTTFHTKSRRSPFKERGKVRQGGRISSSSSSSSSTSLTRKGPFSSSSSPFSSLFTSKASVLPSWSSSSSSSSTSSFLISPFSPSLSPALLPNSDLFLTQSCLLKHQLSSSSSFSSFSPSLIATLHSSQLSSSYCDRQQEGLSSAFQHRSRFFSSRLALRARNFLRMHRSTSPEDFLSLLNQDISFKVPDAKFLRVASGRFLSCIDDFYPPQIVDAFTIFSNIPFSDENLLAAYVSRLDDLLTDPSPRRLTALLSLSTRLGFSHPLAESPLTSSILDRMHYFDISLLPSLCRSIGKVFLSSSSSSLALLDSVSTQVYLTFKPYLFLKSSSSSLLASESSHLSMFIRCVESLSRQVYIHPDLLQTFLDALEFHGSNISVKDSLFAIAALERFSLDSPPHLYETLRRSLQTSPVFFAEGCVSTNTSSQEALVSILRALDYLRLRDVEILEKSVEAAESLLLSGSQRSLDLFLPEVSLRLSRLSAFPDLRTAVAFLGHPRLLVDRRSSFSSSQLLHLLNAAGLTLFDHVQRREGAMQGSPMKEEDLATLGKTVDCLASILQPQFLRLPLREQARLKELAYLFLSEAAFNEREESLEEVKKFSSFRLSLPVLRFCEILQHRDVGSVLPRSPTSVNFNQAEILTGCSRSVLVLQQEEESQERSEASPSSSSSSSFSDNKPNEKESRKERGKRLMGDKNERGETEKETKNCPLTALHFLNSNDLYITLKGNRIEDEDKWKEGRQKKKENQGGRSDKMRKQEGVEENLKSSSRFPYQHVSLTSRSSPVPCDRIVTFEGVWMEDLPRDISLQAALSLSVTQASLQKTHEIDRCQVHLSIPRRPIRGTE